jgi:hypothetical protein
MNKYVENYYVIDNVLPQVEFDKFLNTISDINFPWFYSGTAYDTEEGNTSFSNVPQEGTPFDDYVEKTVNRMLSSVNIPNATIQRKRFALIPKTGNQSFTNEAHIDQGWSHMVGLLYFNDSDGDTILYNETKPLDHYENTLDFYNEHIKGNLSIQSSITPKANRLLLFNGDYYHASSTPTNVGRRMVLNFNFT